MKISRLTKIFTIFMTLELAAVTFAAVPNTITYQGYLKNAEGTPVSTATIIRFSLYSSNPARNNPVWRETRSVTLANGIYSVQLGAVTPIAAPFDLPYHLGVKVEGDPEMPLQSLSSVPYALRAAAVDSGTQTFLTGGAVNKGLVVKGAAGQSANLQEWQNSTGSAVAALSAVGDLSIAGNLLLPAATATTGIIKAGGQALVHSYGVQNFFAGLGAGNTTMTQGWNTGIGRSVLGLNSSGGFNSALGSLALMNNSDGTGNCAMGYSALYDNVSGNANVAIGNGALGNNTGGGYNTAVGNASLSQNTSGSSNTALGSHAGRTVTVANANISGYYNAFIGAYSGPGTATQLTNATAVGFNALVSQSNSLVLGGTGADAVKVGIGTQTPTETLDVVGNARINNKELYLRAGADTNHGLAWFGAGKLFAGSSPDGPVLYGFSGGALGTTSGGQQIALAWNNNNVGIGTSTPSERLEVAGTVKATAFSGSGALLTGLNSASISGTLAIANGGTGSGTQNFVDLSSTQSSIGGNKTFTGSVVAANLAANGYVSLPATTSSVVGTIRSGLATLIHSYGSGNFFAGSNAGNFTMTGSGKNTATGYYTLYRNSTGFDNTANGYDALTWNSSGMSNTATGSMALALNTVGFSNTADGAYALQNNTTASKNTAVGTAALFTQSFSNGGSSWDSYNTAVGFQAMYQNQPSANSNGNYNAALGAYALTDNSTGYNNAAFGADCLKKNTSGFSNTAVGYSALFWNTTGSGNTAFGRSAGLGVGTGSNNTLLGYNADVMAGNISNSTAIGYGVSVNSSNKVMIGNSTVTSIGGYAGWSNYSDIRVKKDIRDIGHGLDLIKALRPVQYTMKNGNGNTDFGFIAQDVETLLGEKHNLLDVGGGEERMLSLRYSQLIAPMVKAIQEQQATIDQLKSELAETRKLLGR